MEYLQKSLKINIEIGNKSLEALNYVGLGSLYLELKNTKKAYNYSKKAYTMAVEIKEGDLIKRSSEILAKSNEVLGFYKEAYKYYVVFKTISDSLYNEENTKKITGLEYQYKYEKEKQETELEQQKKDALHAEEEKQQKILRNSFIVGFILMFMIALLMLRSFLQKRKANRILTLQKKEIEEKNTELLCRNEEIKTQAEEIKTKNEKLRELDRFKEEMIGMIVHDLKNPLNSIIGLSENDIVKQSGKQMLNMIMNILDVQNFENAEIQLNTSNKSISEVSKSALQQVNLLYKQKNIKLENNIQNYFVDIDKEIVERIFVNILTNAIKYTPNNGAITLSSSSGNSPFELQSNRQSQRGKGDVNFICIKITDTGQGIPSDKLDKVFVKFEQVIAKKSGMARSTGIGLTFCKLFTEAHGGDIGVESELENLPAGKAGGTTFWFTLPVGEQGNEEIFLKDGITDEKPFELTPTEKEILNPFLSKLKELEVYESSDIEDIINQIDFSKSENLEKWKKEIDNAIYSMNKEKYTELINLIDDKI